MGVISAKLPIAGPAYVVRTRHHSPPTYVGAVYEQRSTLFAFSSHRLAARVAHGLESQRRSSGAFPVLSLDGLRVDEDAKAGETLEHLDVQELNPHELWALVEGSGVVVCFMRLDDEESDINAHIVYDKKIQRTWIYDLYRKDSTD